jgi:hypothetical protein
MTRWKSVVPVVLVLAGVLPVEASCRSVGGHARAGFWRPQRSWPAQTPGHIERLGERVCWSACALRRPDPEVLAEAMARGFIACANLERS